MMRCLGMTTCIICSHLMRDHYPEYGTDRILCAEDQCDCPEADPVGLKQMLTGQEP